jgi:hypothetical protein
MSMYTQLLDAAFAQRLRPGSRITRRVAVAEVIRCRDELDEGVPPGTDPDTVPVVLALEIGYDVALIELARVVGVDTDPSRFDQPRRERDRLEQAFNDLGIDLEDQLAEQPSPGGS